MHPPAYITVYISTQPINHVCGL